MIDSNRKGICRGSKFQSLQDFSKVWKARKQYLFTVVKSQQKTCTKIPSSIQTSLSEFIFALKCGLLSIFRATSNLSSSTPDTMFCHSLIHRSLRVVKRSNTSPTVWKRNVQYICLQHVKEKLLNCNLLYYICQTVCML